MLTLFMDSIQRVIHLGFTKETRLDDRLIIKTINIIAVVVGLLAFFDLILFPRLLSWDDFVINPTVMAISFTLLYLNYKKRSDVARVLFYIVFPLIIGIALTIYGLGVNGLEILLLPILALLFFDNKLGANKTYLIYWIIFCLVAPAIYTVWQGPIQNMHVENHESYIYIFVALILSTCLSWITINTNKRFLRLNKNLNKKLERQNIRLNQLNFELREANKDLKNFNYVVSHDLKTPLRSMISFQTLIAQKVKDYDDPSLQEYLSYASQSAKHMQETLEDLLVYTKLSTNQAQIKLQSVDVHTLLQQIIVERRQSTDRRETIQIHGYIPKVVGTESFLKLVLQNIIDNGLKYNRADQPKVEISATAHGQEVAINIKDNGLGIDLEHQEKIFEPFQRLHTNKEYEGTGFGLTITKRVIEKLKGRLEISSVKDQGSTFTIHLEAT